MGISNTSFYHFMGRIKCRIQLQSPGSLNYGQIRGTCREKVDEDRGQERKCKGGPRLHEIIEDNFLGPWSWLVLPCPLNFHVRGCDHLAVTCSFTLHAYVKQWLPMTNGERAGTVPVTYTRPRVLQSTQFPSAPRNSRQASTSAIIPVKISAKRHPKGHYQARDNNCDENISD